MVDGLRCAVAGPPFKANRNYPVYLLANHGSFLYHDRVPAFSVYRKRTRNEPGTHMKHVPSIILWILGLLLLAGCTPNGDEWPVTRKPVNPDGLDGARLTRHFVPVESFLFPKTQIYAPDLDGDAISETVVSLQIIDDKTTGCLVHNSLETVLFAQAFYNPVLIQNVFLDIDNDGKKEIFINEIKQDTSVLHAYSLDEQRLFSVMVVNPGRTKRFWECHLIPVGLIDCNQDGHEDLLIVIQTNLAYQPRGFLAYDVKNRREIWRYETGFVPNTVHLIDVTGDGAREIVFGSSAPNNCEAWGDHSLVNGTDDSRAYYGVLDCLGNMLIREHFNQPYKSVSIHAGDTDGDGRPDFLLSYDRTSQPILAFWDPLTRVQKPFDLPEASPVRFVRFADMDGDGIANLFVVQANGTLGWMDRNFQWKYTRRIPDLIPTNLFIHDLDLDSKPDVVIQGFYGENKAVFVFDTGLNLKAFFRGESVVEGVYQTGMGKRNQLILDDMNQYRALYELRRRMPAWIHLSWPSVIIGALFGSLLFLAAAAVFTFHCRFQSVEHTLSSVFHQEIGYLALNSAGKVFSANPAMETWLGQPLLLMKNRCFSDILPGSPLEELAADIEKSLANHQWTLERELSCIKDGNVRQALITITRLPLGSRVPMGRLVCVRDITAFVQSERAVAWAGMAQKLAHEIKTPLSTLNLASHQLDSVMQKGKTAGVKSKRYLAYILEQTERLHKLTDDFLKFAKIEKLRLSLNDINELVRESLKTFDMKIGGSVEIQTELQEDMPHIEVDGGQIKIVLDNLVSNSLNAMEGKGVLRVTTRLIQEVHAVSARVCESIVIEVTDTGKGLPKDQMARLFEPFFTQSQGGTGMGLVIAKKIVEDHHGEIRVLSEESIGTSVRVTLPLNHKSSREEGKAE
ncbi:MAG TPA: PAS domain-containing protein [bacterium]|nr:PAS domain-containing protein [bacterium]